LMYKVGIYRCIYVYIPTPVVVVVVVVLLLKGNARQGANQGRYLVYLGYFLYQLT